MAETDVARPPHPEVVGMVPPPPWKIGQSSPRVVVDGVGQVIVEIGEFRMIVPDETVAEADVYVCAILCRRIVHRNHSGMMPANLGEDPMMYYSYSWSLS